MKSVIISFFLAFYFSGSSEAQSPEQLLENRAAQSPIEKVYLHLDRDHYIAGETAWFKAYLYSDYQPDTISTSLYVELLSNKGNMISRSVLPVLFGAASGHLNLSDSLTSGNYLLRSYSPTMLNEDPGFAGRQNIFIIGRNNPGSISAEKKLRLEFFPEGGNLFAGASNFIAFKATNENGLPVNAKGKLFNLKNEKLLEFDSYHDGMGFFEFTPAAQEKYYVIEDADPLGTKFFLPDPTAKGIAFSVIPHPQGHFFEIHQGEDPNFRIAYMIGQMQHHAVFRQEFKNVKNMIQGVLNTQNLHSGILQVTVFNKDHQPLAERLCFVDNKEYILPGSIIADTLNFSPRAKNKFGIQLKDTVRGSFSVSVTDADYDTPGSRDENIFSSILLTSDLKGYINHPAYYFSGDNDSVKMALDLVMMTNGWRRFRWEELEAKKNQPLVKDLSFITLSGKISLRNSKKPFENKALLLMLITADSTRSVQMIKTDKPGNFKIDSMLFFGRSRLLFSDIRGKNSLYIDAHLSGDSLNKKYNLPAIQWPVQSVNPASTRSRYEVDYESIFKEKGFLLEGVTVRSKRKKTPLEELDEKYTSGAFSTDALKVYDLVNNEDWKFYTDVFEYLRSKGYNPGARNPFTASSLGNFTTSIYIDEYLADEDILQTIPMSRIAMIKTYSSFIGASGNGPGGAIAIYTKKGEDAWGSTEARPSSLVYNGYTITKDFYAPDYSVKQDNSNRQQDNRITLDWRPDILVNFINPKIPLSFYNNDRTKRFRVIVEGMTIEGKMLSIEQLISSKPF